MQLTFTTANCVQRRDTELRPIDGPTLKRDPGWREKESLDKESTRTVHWDGKQKEEREKSGRYEKKKNRKKLAQEISLRMQGLSRSSLI